MDVVQDIKENLCYVALDYKKELTALSRSKQLGKTYTLPDGKQIALSEKLIKCPEALF